MDLLKACLSGSSGVPLAVSDAILRKLYSLITSGYITKAQKYYLYARDVFIAIRSYEEKPISFLQLFSNTFGFAEFEESREFFKE